MLFDAFEILFDPASVIVIAAGAGVFLTLVAAALPYLRPDPLAQRMKAAARRRDELRTQQMEALQRRSRLRRDKPNVLRDLVETLQLRELFAGEGMRVKLIQANWRGSNALAIYAAARAGLPVLFGAGAALYVFGLGTVSWALPSKLTVVFGAVVAGVYGPNLMVTNAIQKRQEKILLAFPDALDLLLICVESGLSIEAAFGRVANELGEAAPELASELELTTAELTYLPERRQALENLVMRTGLPTVKAVVVTMIQAERYGTPLATALRTAAQENRDRRMALAEKKAAALPAQLTVPMILFFLPVLFLAILGPVIIKLSSS